jgi:N utilization substance protein B
MQSLYEWDFRQKDPLIIAKRNTQAFAKEIDWDFIQKVITDVVKNINKIDEKIQKAAPEWPIEQVAAIDKTVLRMAIYELLFSNDVPPKVAINEAVELGKTFGGEKSSKFINGVLGTLYRSSDKYNPEDDKKEDNKEDGSKKS